VRSAALVNRACGAGACGAEGRGETRPNFSKKRNSSCDTSLVAVTSGTEAEAEVGAGARAAEEGCSAGAWAGAATCGAVGSEGFSSITGCTPLQPASARAGMARGDRAGGYVQHWRGGQQSGLEGRRVGKRKGRRRGSNPATRVQAASSKQAGLAAGEWWGLHLEKKGAGRSVGGAEQVSGDNVSEYLPMSSWRRERGTQ
jgi:hypothetical protein